MRLPRHRFTRSLAITALASAISVTTLPALAHNGKDHSANPAAVEQARQQAGDQTLELLAAKKRWANAQGAEKSRALEQLIAKAEARRQFLAELIKTNPAEVLRVAIPDDKQLGMPAEVLEMLEQKIEVEGELDVFHIDTEDPAKSGYRHILRTPFGDRFELHIAGEQPDVQSGTEVNVSGVVFNTDSDQTEGSIAVNADQEGILMLALGGDPTAGEPGPVTNTFGEQKTLVILLNFQDDASQPWSKSEVANLMNGQISDFMMENSYGQTWIKADVAGWFTLPYTSSTCSDIEYSDWANQAAANAGYNLSNYKRLVYAWPRSEACGYLGLGTVGGNPSRAKINGNFVFNTVTHELGHNLGLFHSHDLDCGDNIISGNCSYREYGDYPDIMGSGYAGHFNAFQKDRLGWLGYGNSPELTVVTSSGSYPISPFEAQTSAPKALKILKNEDPNTGYKQWYYLESRQALGFDAGLTSSWSQNYTKGIGVRLGYKMFGNSSALLDMTPTSTKNFLDAALEPGYSYSDADAGVSFTTDWVNSNGAQVTVNIGGGTPTCTRANPSMSVTPGESQWVAAGTAVTYSVTLTNRDSSACSSNSYALSATKPSGWGAALGKTSVSLAPGASTTTTLTVTSASSAIDGFYTIGVAAASGSYTANSNVTYVVSNPVAVNKAPTANNDSASTVENTPVTINVLANDSDPDGDSLSVTSVSSVNGSAVINANGSITFTPANGYTGTTQFSYTISDGKGGSSSATVSVSVTAAPSSNSAPVAVDDSADMSSVSAITIPVLGNDWDPEGTALKVIAATQGNKGSVRVNSDGTLTYTPGNSFKNNDSFTYTITDGEKSASASVTVQLAKGNGSSGGPGNGKGPNK